MVDEGLGFVLVEFLIGADQFVDVAAVAGVFVEPVAQRAGGDRIDLLFGAAIQLMRVFEVAPAVRTRDDLVVPYVVVTALVAVEVDVVALLAGVLHVDGAVHVAYEVDDAAQAHHDGRVVLLFVVLQFGDRVFECEDHVAFRTRCIDEILVHGGRVPGAGMFVTGLGTPFVHPGGVVDDRVAEDLFDRFLRLGREVAFGDVGDGVMAHFSPSEGAVREQYESAAEEQQTFFHKIRKLG